MSWFSGTPYCGYFRGSLELHSLEQLNRSDKMHRQPAATRHCQPGSWVLRSPRAYHGKFRRFGGLAEGLCAGFLYDVTDIQ
jgi:hypothetical protein